MDQISALVSDLQRTSVEVHLPNSERYTASVSTYFAQQEQNLRPAAVVSPRSAQDVADIVKVLANYHDISNTVPYFAVRAGGRTGQAGRSNVEAGITIDLSQLIEVVPAEDRRTVKLGPGAKWVDVYSVLDATGLGISGGRDGPVGVGGLTLGGGISAFGAQRGFVCDDVQSFEIVLANGTIVEASQDSRPDLWRALKGGSNNFGIVTTFTFKSFELGNIWGGQNVFPVETYSKHLDALYNFTASATPDPHASVITSCALYQGNVIVNEGLKYTQPVTQPPSVFETFLTIPGSLHSTNRILSMTEAAIENAAFNTSGRRQALLTTTFVNNRDVLEHAFQLWRATVPEVQRLPSINWAIGFQPMTRSFTQKGIGSGGNVLGLEGAPDLINALITISWDHAEDDDFLINKAKKILAEVDEYAQSQNAYHRYIYLNYAWSSQDPIASYGAENVAFLQEVSKRYDPHGLFQTGLAGGFKLGFHKR